MCWDFPTAGILWGSALNFHFTSLLSSVRFHPGLTLPFIAERPCSWAKLQNHLLCVLSSVERTNMHPRAHTRRLVLIHDFLFSIRNLWLADPVFSDPLPSFNLKSPSLWQQPSNSSSCLQAYPLWMGLNPNLPLSNQRECFPTPRK